MDTDPDVHGMMRLDPAFILEGETPRLIDEWQIEPTIWNYVRRAVDDRAKPGQFILTGSATPPDDSTRHSGAGRFSRIRLRPMSLYESGHSTGEISLEALFSEGTVPAVASTFEFRSLCEAMVIGGWPAVQGFSPRDAQMISANYLDQISRAEIQAADEPRHDPQRMMRLIRSLARNTSTEASISTLTNDAGGDEGLLTRQSTAKYLDTLERIFILEEQVAWSPHLRSKAKLRQRPKRHLVDPSLAAAGLEADVDRLYADLNTTGLLFETLVHRDLLAYGLPLRGRVSHYRDSNGLEVDAIIEAAGLGWGAFEVKLGPNAVDVAAANLLRFRDTVDVERSGAPAFLAVIVATGYGYTREDGVAVVPIGTLGP